MFLSYAALFSSDREPIHDALINRAGYTETPIWLFLRMVKTTTADGKIQFSVSDHDRIIVKVRRPKGTLSRRVRPRDRGSKPNPA
jgi:hypothetical protein